MTQRAFIDFYRAHNISPVDQDISDLGRHFRRRDSLYHFLGLPPSLLQGRRILEFGPGSGHNALFTASLDPSRYVLVDGNPKAIEGARSLLERHIGARPSTEFVESLFEDYRSSEDFDVVLAEGCIPFQRDPGAVLRMIARHARPGGVLVVTTVSSVSFLPETMRRVARTRLIRPDAPVDDQLRVLTPIFTPHLRTLSGMSRSVEDWLIDNIVHPIQLGTPLSMAEAIAALAEDFDVLGSSPQLITDYRWYKDVIDDDRGFNAAALSAYHRRNLNLLDRRYEFPDHDPAFGAGLERRCRSIWDQVKELEAGSCGIDEVLRSTGALADEIAGLAPRTAAAIAEAGDWIARGAPDVELGDFPAWWGRGQQYVSFIRRF